MENFKISVLSVVLIGYLSVFQFAHSGSFDDFFLAFAQDDPAAIDRLIRLGFDPNTPTPEGVSPIHLAIQTPAPKVAKVLVNTPSFKFDIRNAHDETPLMLACIRGMTELATQLISRGADVNKPGWTPLHYAATSSQLLLMNVLLEHHAFIDAPSPNGTTPLMMAAKYGSASAVKLLLEAGADPRLRNDLELSATDFAKQADQQESIALIQAFIRGRPQ
jgi:ankyrin repeat protein